MLKHWMTLAESVIVRPTLAPVREPVLAYEPWREPTLADPVSQLCTARQLEEPDYARWCEAIGEVPRPHRKQWEFAYILAVLEKQGMLQPGKTGLGFGCGLEPLPAAYAARGCTVVASDADAAMAADHGWTNGQHARHLDDLNGRGLCPSDAFATRVSFRVVDMNAIPRDLDGAFDFCWSACAFEHLGGIAEGLAFYENSMRCLKPGGIAVHTTEYNLSSDDDTITSGRTVVFRRRDLDALCRRLTVQGHTVLPLNLYPGEAALDRYVDTPPYSTDRHLKLALGRYAATSVGIVTRRGP